MDRESRALNDPHPDYDSDSSSSRSTILNPPPSEELNLKTTVSKMTLSDEEMNSIVNMVQAQLAALEDKIHLRFNSQCLHLKGRGRLLNAV